MSKKHEGMVAFNHKGTDIMVTPAVYNILKGLTEETKRLQYIESKVKVIEFDNAIKKKQAENFQKQIKDLQKHIQEKDNALHKERMEKTVQTYKSNPEQTLNMLIDSCNLTRSKYPYPLL